MNNFQWPTLLLLLISRFTDTFIIFNFMERVFERAYRKRIYFYAAFIFVWAVLVVTVTLGILLVNILTLVAVVSLTGFFLYGTRKSSDLLIMALFIIFLPLVEILGQAVLSLFYSWQALNSPTDIAQCMITFACYQAVMFFIVKRKRTFNKAGGRLILLSIPFISLLIMYAMTLLINFMLIGAELNTAVIIFAAACVLLFSINIVVFVLFGRIAALNERNERYALMENQRQMQYRYFNELERGYEESRHLFHDIRNHLNTIEQLYRQGQPRGAAYTDALRAKINELDNAPATASRVLNILISGWNLRAKASNINFRYNCEEVDLSFIADMDLNTILTNLMDNAFDACEEILSADDKVINLSVCHINSFIIINVSNRCLTPPKQRGKQFLSQKENHMGLGLSNVTNAVEEYGGTMNASYENQAFTVQITFTGKKQAI